MMIILFILITLSLDNVWILLGENCCWSLLGIKGLKIWVVGQGHGIIIGSLNNDNSDGQENGKRAIGLYLPNNNFVTSALRFLIHFFAVVAGLQSETA